MINTNSLTSISKSMVSMGHIITRYIQFIIVWRDGWEIIIISNLCIMLYAVKSLTFKKSWDAMLFKFQWHIEKYLKELGLGPGFNSMSPLSLVNLMWYNRYTTNVLKIYEK